MNRSMRAIRPGRATCLHIETELGIVNVFVKLRDHDGRKVECVEIIPSEIIGEESHRDGHALVRLIEGKKKRVRKT